MDLFCIMKKVFLRLYMCRMACEIDLCVFATIRCQLRFQLTVGISRQTSANYCSKLSFLTLLLMNSVCSSDSISNHTVFITVFGLSGTFSVKKIAVNPTLLSM
jgi:hypothetical protein